MLLVSLQCFNLHTHHFCIPQKGNTEIYDILSANSGAENDCYVEVKKRHSTDGVDKVFEAFFSAWCCMLEKGTKQLSIDVDRGYSMTLLSVGSANMILTSFKLHS